MISCNQSPPLLKSFPYSLPAVTVFLSGRRAGQRHPDHLLFAPAASFVYTAFISYTSNASSGLTLSRHFRNFSTSKVFFGSASDRYLYCGCFVISNLSEKNGRTPCTCKIHLPLSMTASSSGVISSMQHCQVMSLILRTKKAGTLSNLCHIPIYINPI